MAISQEDWWKAGQSADCLYDTFSGLPGVGNPTLVLAGENQRDDLDAIRRLILDVAECSDAIGDRCEIYDRSETKAQDAPSMKVKVQTYFEQLERLYAELKRKSDLFADRGGSDLN